MKNTLKKIGNWLWENKKSILLLTVVVILMHPSIANAEPTDEEKVIQSMSTMATVFVRFLNTLLWPLLLVIGDLLDVNLITGPGMEERLLAIWREMRSLVNIAIAFMLVIVAFYNVLGLGGGEGELAIKTALPRIVLGLILVNFTYVGGRVMLDVANVGTNIAFSLPQIVEEGDDLDTFDTSVELTEFANAVCYPEPVRSLGNDGQSGTDDDVVTKVFWSKDQAPIQTKLFCKLSEEDTTSANEPDKDEYGGLREGFEALYKTDLNKNNIAVVMAVNMGSLGGLELFKTGAVKTFTDLTVNSIFAVLLYAVFAVSYIVMAIVLIVRLFVLWIALAFSPIAVLIYVIPQIKEWLGGGGDFTQKVIKHLIAPIIFGVTMSMGFLLMDGWNSLSTSSFSAYSDAKVGDVLSTDFLVSGISDLPKLVLAIASIVVIWVGVFAAAGDTYAAGITDKIKDFGGQVKDALFNAPFMLPSLPIYVSGEDKEGMSPMALKNLVSGALDQFSGGNILPSEMKRLSESDVPFVQLGLGNGLGRGDNSTRAGHRMEAMLSELGPNPQLDRQQAMELATYLSTKVASSRTMQANDKKDMQRDLLQLQTRLKDEKSVVPATALQDLVATYAAREDKNGKAYGSEGLGLEISQSSMSRLENVRITNEPGEKPDSTDEESKTADKAPKPEPPKPEPPKPEPPKAPEPPVPPAPPASK